MKLADVMRDLPEHLPEGRRGERRAIGGDTAEGQAACRQGGFSPPEQHPDVLVGGSVIQDLVAETLLTAIIDNGQHAEGAIIAFLSRHIA